MDDLTTADVDDDVADAPAVAVIDADDVAGQQLVAGDRGAVLGRLDGGQVGELDPAAGSGPDGMKDQAAAVEADDAGGSADARGGAVGAAPPQA